VSLADAKIIFLFEKGAGNEKIIHGDGNCVAYGYYWLQQRR
jgi:hypothetical protein